MCSLRQRRLPSGTEGLRNNASDVVEGLTNANGGSMFHVHVGVWIVRRSAVIDDDSSAAGGGCGISWFIDLRVATRWLCHVGYRSLWPN